MPKDIAKTQDQIVRETHKLAKENNRLIRAMRRDAFFGLIFKLIFWAIILGLPVILYFYFLQPYIDQVVNVYGEVQEDVGQISEQASRFGGLFDIFQRN